MFKTISTTIQVDDGDLRRCGKDCFYLVDLISGVGVREGYPSEAGCSWFHECNFRHGEKIPYRNKKCMEATGEEEYYPPWKTKEVKP